MDGEDSKNSNFWMQLIEDSRAYNKLCSKSDDMLRNIGIVALAVAIVVCIVVLVMVNKKKDKTSKK